MDIEKNRMVIGQIRAVARWNYNLTDNIVHSSNIVRGATAFIFELRIKGAR